MKPMAIRNSDIKAEQLKDNAVYFATGLLIALCICLGIAQNTTPAQGFNADQYIVQSNRG